MTVLQLRLSLAHADALWATNLLKQLNLRAMTGKAPTVSQVDSLVDACQNITRQLKAIHTQPTAAERARRPRSLPLPITPDLDQDP